MNEIRWGIIGAGDVCEVKSGPAFNKIEHSKLVAVMRRNATLAEDYAKRHGVPKWYDDADKLINDAEVNAIYIATPPSSHAEYAKKAAAAGKPIYVEKPMATSHADCLTMMAAAKNAGLPLYVAYYRRALPNILAIKKMLLDNIIGEIRFVDIQLHKPSHKDLGGNFQTNDNWRIDPQISGGGYFHDLACHQLDVMDFLLGPILSASGIALNQSNEYNAYDLVIGQFQFKSGIPGQGSWCFNCSESDQKEVTTLYGSKGTISFPHFGDHSVTVHLDGAASKRHTFTMPINIQFPLIQSVVDDLRGVGVCASTGESAARTNQVMEWIIKNDTINE